MATGFGPTARLSARHLTSLCRGRRCLDSRARQRDEGARYAPAWSAVAEAFARLCSSRVVQTRHQSRGPRGLRSLPGSPSRGPRRGPGSNRMNTTLDPAHAPRSGSRSASRSSDFFQCHYHSSGSLEASASSRSLAMLYARSQLYSVQISRLARMPRSGRLARLSYALRMARARAFEL